MLISKSGANPQLKVAFSVKDKNAVQAELLEKAVTNAAEKAAILANASRVSLGAIKHINYSWGEVRLYSETSFNIPAFLEAAPTYDIDPDDVDVDDTVTVIWNIE